MRKTALVLLAMVLLFSLIMLSLVPLSPIVLVLSDAAGGALGYLFTPDWFAQESAMYLYSTHPLSGGYVHEIYKATEATFSLQSIAFAVKQDALEYRRDRAFDEDFSQGKYLLLPLEAAPSSMLALYVDKIRGYKIALSEEMVYELSDYAMDETVFITLTRFSLMQYLFNVVL